jgi:hypothetical protein
VSRVFDAWALPPGFEVPERPDLSFEAGQQTVGYLDADPDWLHGLLDTLCDARTRLLRRTARDIAAALGAVGARFLDPGDSVRAEALELLPAESGLSPQMATVVLDGMAGDWGEERLWAVLAAEFGDDACLDAFVARGWQRSMATGPSLCLQVVSGSVPGVGVTALIRSLLVKSPTLLKPGRGDSVLPVLFASALAEADAELAEALAVVYWPGGSEALEEAALARADTVVAYGGDDVVRSLRDRAPVTTRFVAYHHRVSVGVVGLEGLQEAIAEQGAAALANAVAIFDQRGCVSPQVVYVEEGGEVSPRAFAGLLATSLAALERDLPGGLLDRAEASALHQMRGTAELMAASDGGVELQHGGDAHWTVIFDPAATLLTAYTGRSVQVKPLSDLARLPDLLAPMRAHLQTVGAAGLGDRGTALAVRLGRVGVSRVVPFAEVPFPPPWWHHDGGSPLGDLVRWFDLGGV